MIPVISKLPQTGTNIFTTMSALAAEHDAINLSQGFPDYFCSPELIELVNSAMMAGHNQYAPMAGLPALREQIAIKTEMLYGAVYNPDTEITVTAGATQAVFTAISAVIHPNDEVIMFEPAYDCYAPAVKLMGGVVKSLELEPPDYRIPWDMVKRLITNKTRMIILNSPHNPTATILSKQDIDELTALVKNQDILILSDEVYEHLVFDGQEHLSMARYPELRDRSLIIASFGKTFHATGWKMGYCLAPANLMQEFRKIHQFLVFSVNTPMQHALAEYLKNEDHYLTLPGFFQQKRDHFRQGLEQTRFKLLPCAGAYFQSVTYDAITDEKDVDFAVRLTKEIGVAAIPVSAFYRKGLDRHVLRFCFAKKQETLDIAVDRLLKV
ncbi:aminotransferase class I/II-fold pyridoxal phosphate-dependent enzyme [Mucilaginibacter achroorhodeus]|uniref:Aminotransferase class I/II-fold pyridoxal phosphate-dependent enzyme n=1 Tax=Mucilaginibacter achroorhodeus TaxID=2599294 RepID=A0A563U461_9SPHI|nr:methionine aminotransferase [Mucilaginibacter achroorhodeus]TWR26137.1 aminotransferase class I/II-fold pyridoxal phosphate-dependent enzyme [Mucilaginibacter achroorhodeus]